MSCARVPIPNLVCLLLGRRWRCGRAGGCGGYESGLDSRAKFLVVAVDDLLVRRVEELVLPVVVQLRDARDELPPARRPRARPRAVESVLAGHLHLDSGCYLDRSWVLLDRGHNPWMR